MREKGRMKDGKGKVRTKIEQIKQKGRDKGRNGRKKEKSNELKHNRRLFKMTFEMP